MMKKALILIFLMSFFVLNAQEFTLKKEATKVTFKIKNFGVYVDGDFSDINITTNFDSTNLSQSYINAEIAVKSIATGIESRDKHILEEDYFDEPNHKKIILKSTKIELAPDGDYVLHADLTIKGITKKITIPLIALMVNDELVIKAGFQINRKDFKVGGGSLIMSKKVKIQVEYVGTK